MNGHICMCIFIYFFVRSYYLQSIGTQTFFSLIELHGHLSVCETALHSGCHLLPTSSGHEDVATDVLVDNLTICCHTAEGDVHIAIKLNGNLVQIWQEFIILHRDIYINVRAWKN